MTRSDSMPQNKQNNRFPDLYRLLGLSPLETDHARIELAIKSFKSSENAATDAEVAKSAKLLALAKQHLLVPARKVLYDRKWQQEFRKSTAVGASQGEASDWQWNLLEEFLPGQDPEPAFELAAFIVQTQSAFDHQPSESDLQFEYEKLKSLVSGNSSPATAALQAEPTSSTRSAVALPTSNRAQAGAVFLAAPDEQSELARKAPARKPKSLARDLRRKRERSLVWTVGGVLLSLASVLGAIFFMLNSGKGTQGKGTAVARRPLDNIAQNPAAAAPEIPQRSGLPKVSGLDANADLNPNMEPTANAPQTNDEKQIPENDESLPPMVDANQASTPAANSPEVRNSPLTMTPAAADANETLAPVEMPVVELTDAEKAEWSARMNEIRSHLGLQKYADARQKLEDVAALAKTKVQIEQLIRLKSVAALTEQFQQALVQAIIELEAGETIQVKSTPVSFVDGDAMSVTVRIRGQNKRFELTEIPVGLAWALAELKLDIAHPRSAAMKGAFALFHPASNELVLSQAKELLASAVAEGVVPLDTMSIFADDYRQ